MTASAEQVVAALGERGATVATAESLTGGLLCAALVDVPGASAVVRGGVVAYAPALKVGLLGVAASTIEAVGTVDPRTAHEMAVGVRERLGADWGVSTTGVAGPGPAEGKPAGTVHVAVAGPDGVTAVELALSGDRAAIRRGTVQAALSALMGRLGEESPSTRR
ncbi:MAG: nicotinamide-nucleotide amidohydrolase family protein [Aeromicrobium erythreum]